jgi:hypothetical protein
MIVRVDDRLRDEVARFRLVFACPSCAQFDEGRRTCSLGYPNADHLEPSLDDRETVVFCKAFELV